MRRLSKLLTPISFSEKPFNQTLYLNNDELSVPWNISFKARRYVAEPADTLIIDTKEQFSCEMKKRESEGGPGREKIKIRSTLSDFCRWAALQLSEIAKDFPLRPYILTQYRRRHFVSPENKGIRVTVDTEMAYGFLPEDQPFIWLSREKGLRVEIKTDSETTNIALCANVIELLQKHGALPVISKKDQVYNFHAKYLDQFSSKLQKELVNTEIEAKFLIEHPRPHILFLGLKNAFRQGEFPDFFLDPYPFTQIKASVNFYWTRFKNGKATEGVKLLHKGLMFRAITKTETRILEDSHGLKCLMARQEEKGKRLEYSRENLEQVLAQYAEKFGALALQGYLFRHRLSFWPENRKSGRFYHLTVDRCTKDGKILYQLEIEYVGRKLDQPFDANPQEEILKDLDNLSWAVYQFSNKNASFSHPVLLPSQLTKLEWLIVNIQG